MARRLHPTLMDYVVIAINPAIIMVLIGSLVYFLLELFYLGQYPARLHYCLTLFIVGAVLIGRISIEEGWERASIFAAAMAVVVSLAMHRFVTYQGTRLEQWGWLLNYFLIVLAWWCAHKLTWDCTLVDDSQDASGQGLLQTAGLAEDHAGDEGGEPAASPGVRRDVRMIDPRLARAATDDSILPPDRETAPEKSWWDRFIERRRRKHAPGVWVVYFSLAALPMFGVGQAFIPESNEASRRYAFVLLAIYVAAALALLMTTSFLGLRKYLRQRRMEMPVAMASIWLSTGALLIVGLLAAAALLPRPNAEYDISQLSLGAKSEEHDSSQLAQGLEGTDDKTADSAPGRSSKPEGQKPPDEAGKQHADGGSEPNRKPADNSSGEPVGKNGKPVDSKSNGDQSGQSDSDKGKKTGDDSAKPNQNAPKNDAKNESKTDSTKPSDKKPADDGGKTPTPAEKQPPPQSGGGKPDGGAPAKPSHPNPNEPPLLKPPNVALAAKWVGDLLKYALYAVLIGLAILWLIFNWRTVLDWLQSLLNGWRALWARLFGRGKEQADGSFEPAPRKSFADFSDPFAAGIAGRMSPAELVRYTFDAFEAWASDNGWPREPDETVHDFVRRITEDFESLAAPGRKLAELYSWAAYSPRTLSAAAADPIRDFWQALLRADREQVAVAAAT